ncbi:MAG: hypothetical protein VX764_07965 [Planctomycetota bacterium]|nr:hypothetical protein [Planctomycetota bacterium]
MNKFFRIFTTVFCLACCSLVLSQDYLLYISGPATSAVGASLDQSANFDDNAEPVAGWSYGVCHDTTLMTITGVVDGSTTETVNNGGEPDFNQVNLIVEGYTVGLVICFTGCATLAPGTGYELNVASYTADAEGVATTAFCNSLGVPAVETVVVVNGASVVPDQESSSVEILGVPGPEFVFTAPTETAPFDGTTGAGSFNVGIEVSENDNSASGAPFPNETQGFSMGLGSDPALVAPIALAVTLPFEPDFDAATLLADGWTVGVVYSFTGANTLEFPAPLEVLNVDYDTNAGNLAGTTDNTDAALTWVDTLGAPAVENVVVVGGASLVPFVEDGTITLEPQFVPGPEYTFSAPTQSATYDGDTGEGCFSAGVTLSEVDNSASGADFPNETQGFSMGLGNDSALLEVTAVNVTLPFSPDFAEGGLFPTGWTLGVVYSFTGGNSLAFPEPLEVISADYCTIPGGLAGQTDPTDTALTWVGDLGDPAVDNVVVVQGASLVPNLEDGSITLNPQTDIPFERGNCNGDAGVNIADGIWILNELFQNGPSGTCVAACDINSDQKYDAADAVYVIYYRLLDGPPPPAPFPGCGTEAGVDCEASSYCG